ncbi:MAG: hypothetical protein FD180_4736 [Planctomycetota bacterium]|nr:MAG: hypothetical protein FD180_4736 [Planctomycetota bacterium]
MKRAIAISFLAGAIVSAILVLWISTRRAPEVRAEESSPTERAKAPVTAEADVEALREDLRAAREKLDTLARELAEARKAWSPAVPAAVPKRTWDSLADRIRACAKSGRFHNDDDPLTRELMLEAQSLLRDLAREKGWTLHEAYASPEGWPALVALYLKDADPPMTPEERARLEEALAACRREAEALESRRKDLTGLEIIQASRGISDTFEGTLSSVLRSHHLGPLDDIQELVEDMSPRKMMDLTFCSLPRDETSAKWTSEWSDILHLREDQRIKLGPIIDDLMDALEAMEIELPNYTGAENQKLRSAKSIALMTAAQRRILERLNLDESQMAGFRSWAVVYLRVP